MAEIWISDLPELKGQEFATSKEVYEAEARIQGAVTKKQSLDELAGLLKSERESDIRAGGEAEGRVSEALSSMPMPERLPDGRQMAKSFNMPEDEEAKIYAGLAAQQRRPTTPEQDIGMYRAKYPETGEAYQEGLESGMRIKKGEADILKRKAEGVVEPEIAEAEKSSITEWADTYGKDYPAAAELVRTAINAGDIKTAKEMQKTVIQWMQRVDILNREEENRKRAAGRRGDLKDKDRELSEYEWQKRDKLKIRRAE